MNFNKKQLEAINAEEEKVVVIAPPGSGKTSTMVGAIQKRLADYPKDCISAITFTVAATDELKERVNPFFSNIHISTIHSWSRTQLIKLSEEKGFRIRVMQEKQIRMLVKNMIKIVNPNLYLDPVYYYIMGNRKMDIGEGLKNQFNQVLEAYVSYKEINNLYDFTDYPNYLNEKLTEYGAWITEYDALFVDEFQDVDPIQLRVFERVITKKKFYIGDADQAIYIFRGASNEVFEELTDFAIYNLSINYRSHQEIVDYANSMKISLTESVQRNETSILRTQGHYKCKVKASREDGGSVYIFRTYSAEPEIIGMPVFGYDKIMAGQVILENNPRILCRKNKEVKALQELGYKNVGTVHSAKGLEYQHVLVSDFKIKEQEGVNVAFVAVTRAKDTCTIASFEQIEKWVKSFMKTNPNRTRKLF